MVMSSSEHEPIPYYLAARFAGERPAGRAYFRVQELIFATPEAHLSVFRFQLSRIYHVAILGENPDEELEQRLQRILAKGERVSLPTEVLKMLVERRAQATRQGPWLERHFRPGQPL